MLIPCFLRRGVVYIPTAGMIERGFYRDIEPVTVVAVSNTDALRRAFANAVALGNPKVPPPLRGAKHPVPILLKHAGLKSWNTFARQASHWDFEDRNGVFLITHYDKAPPGGWTKDKGKDETFPPGASITEVIERMIAILQAAAAAERTG
jgi:hypothetical protein